MKIMFITAKYYPDGAGAGRSVRNLALGVTAAGHDAVVVRLTSDKTPSTKTIDGITIHHLPLRNIYWPDNTKRHKAMKLLWHMIDIYNPRAMADIAKLIDEEQPDIVNTNIIAGFSAGIFRTVKKRGIPLVHTMRDYYLLCTQSAMFWRGKNLDHACPQCVPFIPFRRLLSRSVDMFLANSAHVLNRHRAFRMINDRQIAHVQWNANDDDKIAAPKTLKNKTIRFGYIGRVSETKGIETILSAIKALKTKDWTLTIAGTGEREYLTALKALSNDKRIEYIGHTNPDDFYSQIDVLICPSIYAEPLPRVVYEAYRAALPVLASNAGGTPEIIDDGKTGFLFGAGDANALGALMDHIAADPDLYQSLSQGAVEKAALFTRTKITKEFLDKITPLTGGDKA